MLRLIFVFGIILVGIRFAAVSAYGALLFYLWNAYFRPEYWVWDGDIIQALDLSLLIGVYLVLRYPSSDGKMRFDLRAGLLFSFLGLSLASSLASGHFDARWYDFAKSIVITFMIPSLATDKDRFRQVIMVIALSLGFEGAKQGWATLYLHPGGANNNPSPFLGDNNGVALGMLMCMPLFAALARTAAGRKERWLHWFFAGGVTYRAISTYSRGAFLAAGALAIVYVMRSKRKWQSAIAVAVVSVTIIGVLPQSYWDRMNTIKTSEDELEENSAKSRPHFWRVAVEMAQANPVLGVGFYNYPRVYDQYDFSHGLYGSGRAVHSMWFGALGELGYPGLFLYVTTLLIALFTATGVARRARRGDIPIEFYYYGVALETAFVALFVGGSFLPFQYMEIVWHYVGLSMALRVCAAAAAVQVPATAAAAAPRPRVYTGFKPAAARSL